MKKRSRLRRLLAGVLAGLSLLPAIPQTVRAEEYWPDGMSVKSPSAIVMEVNTGTILYEKNIHKQYYPASITKIMTTLLAIENCDMDEIVTFSADAVYKNEGDTSHIARDLGEKLTVEQCLYGIMLESANECAYAIAEHVGQKLGGDYQTFINLMNTKAKELGCQDTHFNNCNGLPDDKHYVSAYDMALISAAAYKNETFRIITGAASYTIPATNKHEDPYYCHNHHKMIYPWQGDYKYLYDDCTGGKTGFTKVAGSTLVSFAEKDGMTLVCVILNANSPDHYTDTRELMDYCFENFQALNISENEKSIAEDKKHDRGLLNNNNEFVQLDKEAYIIMPKAAKFDDAEFEEDKQNDDGTIAKLTYTYADRVVGGATIETTGAKVEENYFEQKANHAKQEDHVIWIRPVYIVLGIFGIVGFILIIFLIKRLYDNFYLIRHKHELRKMEKARFKVNDRKKRYRKKDRLFK